MRVRLHIDVDLFDFHTGEIFNFIFYIADKVICNCTDVNSIGNNYMKIQADPVVFSDCYADAVFQAVFAKKFYQSVLHTDSCHSNNTETFYSNTSCIGSNYVCINDDCPNPESIRPFI